MPSNPSGVKGGLVGLVELEVAEQFGNYTNLTSQVNANTNAIIATTNTVNSNTTAITANTAAIEALKPKYFLGTQSNAPNNSGTITYSVNFNELGGILDYSGGTFTKTSPGSHYFLFNPNFTWTNGASVYIATVKYTPGSGVNQGITSDFMAHSRVFNSNIGTAFATSFSFVIRMTQNDTLFITSGQNYNVHSGGHTVVTLLG